MATRKKPAQRKGPRKPKAEAPVAVEPVAEEVVESFADTPVEPVTQEPASEPVAPARQEIILTQEQIQAYAIHFDRIMCPLHFYYFVQRAFRIAFDTDYIDGWHIQAICYHLQALWEGNLFTADGEPSDTLVVNLPPGCGKSMIASVLFPAWVWSKEPSAGLWFASFGQGLCDRDALAMRRLVTSDWYRSTFWPDINLLDDQNQKRRYDNSKGGWRLSASIESKVGFGEHPRLLVVDDPHDPEQALSAAQREICERAWTNKYSTRGIIKGVKKVVIAQRLGERDLSSLVLSEEGTVHLMLPMEFEPERRCVTNIRYRDYGAIFKPGATNSPIVQGWSDPRTEPGQLLWPRAMDAKKVRRLKQKMRRPHIIAGQLQQRPTSPEGDQFQSDWFAEAYIVDKMPEFGRAARGWDKASSTNKKSDYTAGGLVVEKEGIFYICDVTRGKWERKKRDSNILARAEADHLRYAGCMVVFEREGGGGGKDAAEIAAEQIAAAGFRVRIVPSRVKKETRWEPLADAMANGRVRFVRGPWLDDFREECLAAPHGLHDDQLDAVSLAFNKLATGLNRGRVNRDLLLVTPEEEAAFQEEQMPSLDEDLRGIFDRACGDREYAELGVRW